jgi:hypothetical protein
MNQIVTFSSPEQINRFRPSQAEIDRRYNNVRAAMEEHGLDALIVSGSEYSGFEGAVRYMAGFHILHRYAYVVITPNDDPIVVFPREATWVGDHSATFLQRRELPVHCGEWMADYLKGQGANKVGVYGMEFIMSVRDYKAVAAGGFDLVDFDIPFDYARAQKSDEEIASVRHSMEINKQGVLEVIKAYQPGKTEAELMGVAENVFATAGCGRNTMDMVQMGPNGSLLPQMVSPDARWHGRNHPRHDGCTAGISHPGTGEHESRAYCRGSAQDLHATLRGSRLPFRPRLRPQHRHDHDRDAPHRRGLRFRAAGEHGLLHAPPRDERGAHPLPVLPGDLPGDHRRW